MNFDKIKNIKLFLLDMDGTIYLGDNLFPEAADFLKALKAGGKDYIFLTNNSSKNAAAYLAKLTAMGIEAQRDNLIISTDLLIYYLKQNKPGATLFPVGNPQFEEALRDSGFKLIHDFSDNPPDYVVVAFDTTLHYEKLFHACSYIRNGISYIATHPDLNCPLEDGIYMPDCGAIIEFIRASTGVAPAEIVGKPNITVVEMFMERGYEKNELAMVGDRLYTDIRLGKDSGINSILVLSGETTLRDVDRSEIKPDFIFNDVGGIIEYL